MTEYITEAEEEAFSLAINDGSPAERDQAIRDLATRHLDLVYTVAKSRSPWIKPWDLADTIGDGNVGLMKAASSFHRSRGKFKSWANKLIRQAISEGMKTRDPRMVKIPGQEDLDAVQQYLEEHPGESVACVSKGLGISQKRVKRAKEAMAVTIQFLGDEENGVQDIEDMLVKNPADAVAQSEMVAMIHKAARDLGLRDPDIELICSRKEDNFCERLAAERGVVPSAVRMLKRKLLGLVKARVQRMCGGAKEFNELCHER